jgi:anthranilate phosphoribosyltransferase
VHHRVRASGLGLTVTPTARLAGGTAEENARAIEGVLRGEPGTRRDVVLLNAAAGLLVADLVEDMEGGVERAALTIDAGLAADLLARLRSERRDAERQAAVGSDTSTPEPGAPITGAGRPA